MGYEKDFDTWNIVKKNLECNRREMDFFEKEIWWVAAGVNVGSEQDGKGSMFGRPVLIYKKINSGMFIGIPITSVLKYDSMRLTFYFEYNLYSMLIFQIKAFDSKRLIRKIGTISNYLYRKTKKTTTQFLS